MNVQEFVRESLKQIINGVSEAQEYLLKEKHSGKVNPGNYPGYAEDNNVQFDIAVTTDDSTQDESDVGGNIKVLGFVNFGGKGKIIEKNTEKIVSRLKFTVPVAFGYQRED